MSQRWGPFDTLLHAEGFAWGVEFAKSYYGESEIDGPEVRGEPHQADDKWWLDVGTEGEEDEVDAEGVCRECGEPCFVDAEGISHHGIDHEAGGIDHDADADHVAIPEAS